MVQFNGTLGFKSEYSGDPSPEVDAAWEPWSYGKWYTYYQQIKD